MIYEAYQEKVLKVASFLRKILKHLALIISAISVVILLLISFLATKGMILGEIDVDRTVTYGEGISVSAKALFSKVEYEYSLKGEEEWAEDAPTIVGEYEVRAKSKASFGKHKYSDGVEFSIVPRDIDVIVVSSNVIYGEYPKFSAAVANGDKLECAEFIYEDLTKKTTDVEANKDSIKIYTENGKDVTSCYNINTEPSKINITPRPLEVTVSSKSMVYNGMTLAYDGYEISDGTLVYEDRIGAEFNSSITEVGNVINSPELVIRNKDGVDVSEHYSMTVRTGKLTVTQRPIVLITATDEKTYDGEALENSQVDVYYGIYYEDETEVYLEKTEEETLGGILEGQTTSVPETSGGYYESADIEIEPMPLPDEIETELLTTEILVEVTSWDENLSENVVISTYYEIGYVTEEITEDVIYEDTTEKETSGGNYVIEEDKVGLVEGHKLVLNRIPSITNAGSIENVIYASICDESGEDKSYNYSMFYDFGTLTVNKRKLTVTTDDGEWTYDGDDHTTPVVIGGEGIADANTYEAIGNSINNVGTQYNRVTLTILDKYGISAIDNYEIVENIGVLTVTHRQIWVKSESGSFVYDGYNHTLGVLDFGTDMGYTSALADGQQLVVLNIPTYTDATDGVIKNIVEYKIYDGNVDVTSNYAVIENWGTVEIAKRSFTYETESYDALYDGKTHIFGIIFNDSLFDNMAFTPIVQYEALSIKNVVQTPCQNKISDISIKHPDTGEDISGNFIMECTNTGTINIHKRQITIKTFDGNWVYDGYTHQNTYVEYYGDGLADGEVIEVLKYASINDVETIKNSLEYVICDAEGIITDQNYNVEKDYGTLTVTKRVIQYSTGSYNELYDGYEHVVNEIIFENGTGFEGMAFIPQIYYKYYAKVKNYTPTPIENTISFDILSNKGEEINNNFDVECISVGTLNVRRRQISVTTPSNMWTYDGQWHSEKDIYFGYDGIADNDRFNIISAPEIRDNTHGYIRNNVSYEILNDKGENSMDLGNYEVISINEGTLKIDPVHIYVYSYDETYIYDGYEHSPDIYIWRADTDGLVFWAYYNDGSYNTIHSEFGDTLYFTAYTAAKYFTDGRIYNNFDFTILNYDGEDMLYGFENYVIDSIYSGSFEILKRQLNYSTPTNNNLIYNGKYQSAVDVTFSEYNYNGYDGLAYGDVLQINSATEVIDYTGSYVKNIIDFTIVDEYGNDMSFNYELHESVIGTLLMNRRRVYINTNSNTWQYDGNPHYDDGFTVNNTYSAGYDIIEGDILTFGSWTYITEVGSTKNILSSPSVYSSERQMDVTFNYQIVTNSKDRGTLTIIPRKITVKPIDAKKVYDGEYLTVTDWEYAYSSENYLLDGHYAVVTYINNSYVNAGVYKSEIYKFEIYDEYGNPVTGNYDVTRLQGTINIEKLHVKIYTDSASKEYDGTPLTAHSFSMEFINGYPIYGHEFYPNITGIIIGVGIVDNTMDDEVVVYDMYGNDVSSNYTFSKKLGQLEIYGRTVAQIYSDRDGYVYVKSESFGDYVGNGFNYEPIYSNTTYDGRGPEALASSVFEGLGYQLTNMLLSGTSDSLYFQSFYNYDYYFVLPPNDYGFISVGVPGEYSEYEERYRDWVYKNYLNIDSYTEEFMNEIIAQQGFDRGLVTIYDDVAKFVQSSAKYGYSTAEMLDASTNIAIDFFKNTYGDEALCRHYATAATMLFRAMDIPARYTVGHLAETKAYTWMDITEPGHAWVEVYIDRVGWIPVEVTAGTEGFSHNGDILEGGFGGIKDSEEKIKLSIKPKDMKITFNGDYVWHTQEFEGSDIIRQYQNLGYVFDVTVGQEEAIYCGIYETYIKSVRIYYNGSDVTYMFDIDKQSGIIEITKAELILRGESASKTYDTYPLYAPDAFVSNQTMEKFKQLGYSFDYDLGGEITEVGTTYSYLEYFKVISPDGVDITEDNFVIIFTGGKLTVSMFEIQIYLYQNNKVYDGKTLTYADAFGERAYYKVMNTLPEGFELTSFEVTVSMTSVGSITVDDFNYNSDYYWYLINDDYDLSRNFAIKFVKLTDKNGREIDYTPMQISPRKITVTTESQTKVYDGEPLYNHDFTVGGVGMADGEYIELEITSECNRVGAVVENRVDCIYITNVYGEREMFSVDVDNGETLKEGNYEITFIYGTLKITE